MSKTTNFTTGAVRSADVNHLDFTSLPLVGLLAVARTSSEGGTKYGRFNYMKGMPVHDLLNHVFGHLVNFLLGDRSEPHLAHAAWGLLAAIQSLTLDPELSAPNLLGPGATLTPAVLAELAKNKPDLKRRREAGEFDDIGNWSMHDLPEIQTLLGQRRAVQDTASFIESLREIASVPAPDAKPPRVIGKDTFGEYVREEQDYGQPNPGQDERYITFANGTRRYYIAKSPRTASHKPAEPFANLDDVPGVKAGVVLERDTFGSPRVAAGDTYVTPPGDLPLDPDCGPHFEDCKTCGASPGQACQKQTSPVACYGSPGCRCDTCNAFDAGVRP